MGLYFGSTHIKELYFGSQKIASAYYGNQLVYKQAGDLYPNVKIGNYYWTTEDLSINDGGSGIWTSSYKITRGPAINTVVTKTYYSIDAAKRIVNKIQGWHLPTTAEFVNLVAPYSGKNSPQYRCRALRSTAWASNATATTAGTNTTLFNAYPNGIGRYNGTFAFSGNAGDPAYATHVMCGATSALTLTVGTTAGWNWTQPKTGSIYGLYSIRLVKDY